MYIHVNILGTPFGADVVLLKYETPHHRNPEGANIPKPPSRMEPREAMGLVRAQTRL